MTAKNSAWLTGSSDGGIAGIYYFSEGSYFSASTPSISYTVGSVIEGQMTGSTMPGVAIPMSSPLEYPLPNTASKEATSCPGNDEASLWTSLLEPWGIGLGDVGVIVVDHGSRRAASNDMLELFARLYLEHSPFAVVEPAHMELAEPTIAQAFTRCVEQGARLVLVSPFFLLPGRHWTSDIPHLVQEAARSHPDVRWLLAAPLGLHPLLPHVMLQRAETCLRRLRDPDVHCDVCQSSGNCQAELGMRLSGSSAARADLPPGEGAEPA
jgi:sirohydrochlorin ferrochelatase